MKTSMVSEKKLKGFKSLRLRILTFVGVPILAVLLVLGIAVVKLTGNSVEELTNDTLVASAQSVSNEIDGFFQKYMIMVDQAAADKQIQHIVSTSNKLSPMKKNTRYSDVYDSVVAWHGDDSNILSIFIADIDSYEYIDSNGEYKNDYDLKSREWFVETEKNGTITVSEPYSDVTTNKTVVTISVPIYVDDVIEGAVGIDLLLDELSNNINNYKLGETGYYTLVSDSGTILANIDKENINKNFNDINVSDNIKSAVLSGTNGAISYLVNGEEFHGYVDKIEGLDWIVVSSLNDTEFYQERTDLIWLMLAIFILSTAALAIVIFIVSNGIVSPIKSLTKTANEIAEGKLDMKAEVKSRDEIGQMADAINKTVLRLNRYLAYITEVAQTLDNMADGDMRIELKEDYVGQFKAVKDAFGRISASINSTLYNINIAADQVNMGSSQIASGSQALASGSTEQASSVEELSASVKLVEEQANENANNVTQAAEYVTHTTNSVMKGNKQMSDLTSSMEAINEAFSQITNITKLIEDIAFQTNILALNAAIEAARAGSAGKGFAVVADEVRNLAGKSSEAAKRTNELIMESFGTVTDGVKIANDAAESLGEIAEKAELVNDLILKINLASESQAEAIREITLGLTQVSTVIQTNAATAEESSAASEELAAQANSLHSEVAKFKLDEKFIGN